MLPNRSCCGLPRLTSRMIDWLLTRAMQSRFALPLEFLTSTMALPALALFDRLAQFSRNGTQYFVSSWDVFVERPMVKMKVLKAIFAEPPHPFGQLTTSLYVLSLILSNYAAVMQDGECYATYNFLRHLSRRIDQPVGRPRVHNSSSSGRIVL